MIIVTGGAGFIGSNLVLALNRKGHDDIIVVDNLTDGTKFSNLVQCSLMDFLDKDQFIRKIENNAFSNEPIEAVFHQGACSTTTEWNGRYMMENNYEYSKILFQFCCRREIPFIYASSAAVYGTQTNFKEHIDNEIPINVYGYSKFQFDQYLRRHLANVRSQVVGLRYFNVYGPREHHKGSMASVAFHLNNQILSTEKVNLFQGHDGYDDGEQRRDFIYVDDIAAINLWFFENPGESGIFNAGTGTSRTFNDVARAIINYHSKGAIEYIPFPDHLKGCYQSFTQADITALRSAGYKNEFKSIDDGVALYLDWLNKSDSRPH